METPHRVRVCRCGGVLLSDKSAVTSDNGFRYRARLCEGCGKVTRTKQPPEEVCVEAFRTPLQDSTTAADRIFSAGHPGPAGPGRA